MTKVVIVLGENGEFVEAYSDSEVDFELLQKGKDDNRIEVIESTLEPLE